MFIHVPLISELGQLIFWCLVAKVQNSVGGECLTSRISAKSTLISSNLAHWSGDTRVSRSRVMSNIFKLLVKLLSSSSLINNPVICCDHLLIEYVVILWYTGFNSSSGLVHAVDDRH